MLVKIYFNKSVIAKEYLRTQICMKQPREKMNTLLMREIKFTILHNLCLREAASSYLLAVTGGEFWKHGKKHNK